MNNIYAALEIANGGVKLLVGYYFNGRVYVLHALQSTSASLTNGYIDDVKKVAVSIKEVVNSAQSQLGYKIEEVCLCLPPIDMEIKTDTAMTSTVGSDSIVTGSDVINVTTMIKKKVSEPGKKIVAIIPHKYLLDNGQSYRELPSRAFSNSLTVEADCELVDENIFETYKEACEEAGLKVQSFVLAPFATIKLLESYEQIPAQYVLIDIGAKLTDIALVFENRLLAGRAVSFGGDDVVKAVAKELNLTFDQAFRYVEVYGLTSGPSFEFRTEAGFTLDRLAAVIRKTLVSLSNHIKNALNEFGLRELPTVILSGGGANLVGLDEFISETFMINVMVFTPKNFGARNKSYANLLGMIKYISLNPPKNYQRKNTDFTLTRVGIPVPGRKGKPGTDDESL